MFIDLCRSVYVYVELYMYVYMHACMCGSMYACMFIWVIDRLCQHYVSGSVSVFVALYETLSFGDVHLR